MVSTIEEPRTDKECYVPGDKGVLTVSYYVAESAGPLDKYRVVWNTRKDGAGSNYINGSKVLIYQNRDDRTRHEARWRSSVSYQNGTVSWKWDVVSLEQLDDTPHLFALIVDACSGQIVAISESYAKISVSETCPSPASSMSTTSRTQIDESHLLTEGGIIDDGAIPWPASLQEIGDNVEKTLNLHAPVNEIKEVVNRILVSEYQHAVCPFVTLNILSKKKNTIKKKNF